MILKITSILKAQYMTLFRTSQRSHYLHTEPSSCCTKSNPSQLQCNGDKHAVEDNTVSNHHRMHVSHEEQIRSEKEYIVAYIDHKISEMILDYGLPIKREISNMNGTQCKEEQSGHGHMQMPNTNNGVLVYKIKDFGCDEIIFDFKINERNYKQVSIIMPLLNTSFSYTTQFDIWETISRCNNMVNYSTLMCNIENILKFIECHFRHYTQYFNHN